MKRIIFCGDSVTDARNSDGANHPYGTGFVALVQNTLLFRYFGRNNIEIINKGIGGQTLLQISQRFKNDVLDNEPDALFFLAGVNDSWRKFDSLEGGTSDENFREEYEKLIFEAKETCPKMKIVLMTPYALSVNEMSNKIENDLSGKIAIVRKIAFDNNLKLIDLDKIFHQFGNIISKEKLALDGVHPSIFGCSLIAEEVVQIIEEWYF